MSDLLNQPVLSSHDGGQYVATQDGAVLLPPFWDEAMARFAFRGTSGTFHSILGVSDSVEWLMRAMMREPMISVPDRVLRALVTEGKHKVVPAIPKEPTTHGNSTDRKQWQKSQRAFELTEKWVNNLQRPLSRVCWHLMESVAFGHKLCELELGLDGGNVVPIDISPKPRTSYRIKVDKANRVIGIQPQSSQATSDALVPPANVLIMSVGGMDDDPTGEPALASAYKPWNRKDGDLKNQGMSLRQAGGGFLVIEEDYPPQGVPMTETVKVKNADGTIGEDLKSKVAATEASKLRGGTAGKLPPGMKAKFLQSSGGAIFEGPLDRSDREMVMCFLGQARQILSSDANSQADSGEAAGVAATMRDLYRGLLCFAIQGLFKTYVVLNLGADYADVVPTYDIVTEEDEEDLTEIGQLFLGAFDKFNLEQKNYFMSKFGAPEFTEEDHEAQQLATDTQDEKQIAANDQAATEKEVAAFAASFPTSDLAQFATRLEITNGAAQRRIGGKNGAVRSADRQFRSLVTRLSNGTITEKDFTDKFATTLQAAHERAYAIGYKHGGGGATLSAVGDEYVATTVASEGEYAGNLAAGLADGTVSKKAGLARARQYANRVRGSANEGFREASVGTKTTIDWILGSTDPCLDCPRLAGLSPWQPDELFQVPGDGSTPCRANCQCHLVRSDGRQGFGPVDFSA